MCGAESGPTRSRLSLALVFVALWCIALAPMQGQSLTSSSVLPEPLWRALLPIAQRLPQQYKAYTSSLTDQVESLQANNQQLQDSNAQLQISNQQLQDSNQLLTSKNADLTQSQAQSQAQAATLEKVLTQLRKDLSDSTQSIIQAQTQARVLEAQLTVLRIGSITLGVSTLGFGGYLVGHLLRAW